VSPIGIIYSDPKFYLVARTEKNEDRNFIIQSMIEVELLDQDVAAKLPSLKAYLKNDVKHGPNIFGKDQQGTVELEVFNFGNIIRDLQTFKLAENQKEQFTKSGTLKITLDDFYVSFEFVHWILARENAVKVLAPKKLQEHIKESLENTLKLYQ